MDIPKDIEEMFSVIALFIPIPEFDKRKKTYSEKAVKLWRKRAKAFDKLFFSLKDDR